MSFEQHREDHPVKRTHQEDDDLPLLQFSNKRLAKDEELLKTTDEADFPPTPAKSKPTSINKKSLSLVLSLRIHDQFLSQACLVPPLIPSLAIRPWNTPPESPHLLAELQKEINRDGNSTDDLCATIPLSAKQLQSLERRKHRHQLQREIIFLAKKAIKPSYRKRYITKDQYKTIMKKVVTKATYSNRVDQQWIDKRVNSYVQKYRLE